MKRANSRFSQAINKVNLSARSFSMISHDPMAESSVFDESKYNRKEKSLGELCRKFLSVYGSQDKDLLLLDQCQKQLDVERRRIYDIINILESFCVIRR